MFGGPKRRPHSGPVYSPPCGDFNFPTYAASAPPDSGARDRRSPRRDERCAVSHFIFCTRATSASRATKGPSRVRRAQHSGGVTSPSHAPASATTAPISRSDHAPALVPTAEHHGEVDSSVGRRCRLPAGGSGERAGCRQRACERRSAGSRPATPGASLLRQDGKRSRRRGRSAPVVAFRRSAPSRRPRAATRKQGGHYAGEQPRLPTRCGARRHPVGEKECSVLPSRCPSIALREARARETADPPPVDPVARNTGTAPEAAPHSDGRSQRSDSQTCPTHGLQIEGGVTSGGRTESIWDHFTKQPGKIYASASGNVATDHYSKYAPHARRPAG